MKKACVLVLDNIRSVENTGSIFRTAEGLGAGKVFLIGTTPTPIDRFGRKRGDFAKVALGAEKTLDWEHRNNALEVLEELKEQGFQILSLEQDKRSKDLKDFHPQEQFALVVGNEVDGVSKDVLDISDSILEIEMMGEKESLNVSVSTGIALYKLLG